MEVEAGAAVAKKVMKEGGDEVQRGLKTEQDGGDECGGEGGEEGVDPMPFGFEDGVCYGIGGGFAGVEAGGRAVR